MLNKTRAKNLRGDGEWVQGFYIKGVHSYIITEEQFDNAVVSIMCHMGVHSTLVDEKTVSRYAGTTKGGQDVHEGSILSMDGFKGVVKWVDGSQKDGIGRDEYPIGFVVKWEESWWRTDLGFWLNEREITVIGNVHDNLELVEG